MKKLIIHLTIILTAMMITLFILDYLNPLMGFLSRKMSKFVIILWAISIMCSLICAIIHFITRGKKNEGNN